MEIPNLRHQRHRFFMGTVISTVRYEVQYRYKARIITVWLVIRATRPKSTCHSPLLVKAVNGVFLTLLTIKTHQLHSHLVTTTTKLSCPTTISSRGLLHTTSPFGLVRRA
jgi:hypothetical protein